MFNQFITTNVLSKFWWSPFQFLIYWYVFSYFELPKFYVWIISFGHLNSPVIGALLLIFHTNNMGSINCGCLKILLWLFCYLFVISLLVLVLLVSRVLLLLLYIYNYCYVIQIISTILKEKSFGTKHLLLEGNYDRLLWF